MKKSDLSLNEKLKINSYKREQRIEQKIGVNQAENQSAVI